MRATDAQGTAQPIRRLPDGSIDVDHYRARAEQLRAVELAQWMVAACRWLARTLGRG